MGLLARPHGPLSPDERRKRRERCLQELGQLVDKYQREPVSLRSLETQLPSEFGFTKAERDWAVLQLLRAEHPFPMMMGTVSIYYEIIWDEVGIASGPAGQEP